MSQVGRDGQNRSQCVIDTMNTVLHNWMDSNETVFPKCTLVVFTSTTVAGSKTSKLQEILTQVNHFSPKLTTLFLQTALAKKPPILQLLPYSKVELNLLTDWKVMAKKSKFCWLKVNYLAIAFDPVVRLNPNFENGKICRIDVAKAVCTCKGVNLGEKWLS